MMRRAGAFLLLALAFAAAGRVGWWMIPLVALLWGVLRPSIRGPAAVAALAAASAAAAWLVVDGVAGGGSLLVLADRLARLMSLPIPALFAASVFLPALLSWSGAVLGAELGARPSNPPPQPNH